MTRYAAQTTVSCGQSKDEIERIITRYGATGFGYGWEKEGEMLYAKIGFKMNNRMIGYDLVP